MTNTQDMKVLNLSEELRILWQDGSDDVVKAQFLTIETRRMPFYLAAAQRRRRQKGRTDEIKQVLVGFGYSYCVREWDVAAKAWCEVRDVACHDCGQPKRRRKADRLGRVLSWKTNTWVDEQLTCRNDFERHICTPRKEPVAGTTYKATRCAGVTGLIGSYSVEWRASNGALLGGLMSSRHACEQQLRVWGFNNIVWTSK